MVCEGKRGRPKKALTAKEVLERGTLIAANTLIRVLSDEQATSSLKVDCAKEILNRVYGKTFNDEDKVVNVVLSEELKKYCE